MPDSPLSNLDTSTQYDDIIYTSGFAFHQNILHHVHPGSIIRICTYNVGINISVDYLYSVLRGMGTAAEIRMLVGHNPHHMENIAIKAELQRYLDKTPTLTVKLQERQHAKLVLIDSPRVVRKVKQLTRHGWAGSLNFINPTLADVMVELNLAQCKALVDYFDHHWCLAKPFGSLVQ